MELTEKEEIEYLNKEYKNFLYNISKNIEPFYLEWGYEKGCFFISLFNEKKEELLKGNYKGYDCIKEPVCTFLSLYLIKGVSTKSAHKLNNNL